MEDMELYYAVATYIEMELITVFSAMAFFWLVCPFLVKRKYAWFTGVVYFAVMEVLYYIPIEFTNFTTYFLATFSTFLVMCLIDRRNLRQKSFLSVTFFSIRWTSLAMVNCIDKVIFYETQRIPGYSLNQKLQWRIFLGERVCGVILTIFFLGISVWLIHRAYVYKYEPVSSREFWLLSMPSITGMAGYAMHKQFDTVYERDTGKTLFDQYGTFDLLYFLYCAITMLTILVVVVLFQNLKRRQEEEQQKELLLRQMEDMRSHIVQVERLYRDIRGLRHDMNNHVLALESLYLRKEEEEAKRYLSQWKEDILKAAPEMNSGNPVTDVILSERQKEAEEKGVKMICDFHYPQGTQVDAFDISVILNNGLANAIEAAQGCDNSRIHITSCRRKNTYMIEIKNPCRNQVRMDERSGLPITTKPEGKGRHGFGLANVRRTAQKYHGDIAVEWDGNTFILCVMLMVG